MAKGCRMLDNTGTDMTGRLAGLSQYYCEQVQQAQEHQFKVGSVTYQLGCSCLHGPDCCAALIRPGGGPGPSPGCIPSKSVSGTVPVTDFARMQPQAGADGSSVPAGPECPHHLGFPLDKTQRG
eukprot:1136169-Pelagomonas_calceolata.AAC.5